MELGTEISQKLKKTIKKQLQTLGSYVDDELPEYIMVMIANKRTKEQMVEDLHLFLNDEAGKFVNWLLGVLEKIQKAIQLTCINDEPTKSGDGDSISEDESPIKIKKKAKKNDIESSSQKKQEEKPKRKFSEKKQNKVNRKNSINGDRKEGAHSDSKEKRRRSNERRHSRSRSKGRRRSRSQSRRRSRSKSRRRSRSKGRRRSRSKSRRRSRSKSKVRSRLRSRSKDRRGARSRSKDRRRERSRSNVRRRSRSRSKDRRHSLTGRGRKRSRSVERERPTSQEKKPSQQTIKQQNLTERKHSLDKGEIAKPNISASPNEIESFSKEELYQRNEREHNPMDFVKRIAKDINAKLAGKQTTREEVQLKGEVKLDSVEVSVKNEGKVESSDVIEASSHENVSLQAVGQYEDGDNNDHDKIVKSLDKKVNEDENNKHRERKEFSRSRSPRRRCRSRSRSRSPEKTRNRRNDERRTRRSSTKREDVKRSSDNGRNNQRRSFNEHKDKVKHIEKHSSHEHRKTKEEKRRREKVEKETDKDKLASQINVADDLKKKPVFGKSLQASSALLKKAMNEAVSETQKKSIEDVGEVEDCVGEELDYSEDIDDTLHIGKESKDFDDDRRVIDFNQKGQGLATITINFKSPNGSESEDKANENIDDDDIALRKGLLQDMSKMDARYAIIKSRLDQKDDKIQLSQREDTEVSFDRHGRSAPKEKPRFLGSMVADLEEKSTKELKKRHKYERRQDRKRMIESERHKRVGRGRHRNRRGGSSDEEVLSAEQVQRLTDESHRVKLQELKRNMVSAREGDLRSLLDGKRRRDSGVTKTKSSDDEETVERKLREKIKEEKHMRLFGKLNRGDRDRLSKERQELRLKLEKTRRRRRKHSDRETRRSSRKSDLDDKKTKEKDQIEESSDSDQWVETEAPLQQVDKGVEGDEDGVSDWDEAPTQNRSYILDQEVYDEHEGEEQIDQHQINEEEKHEKSGKEEEIEISKDVLLASVHKEEQSKLEMENENLDSEKKQEIKRKKIRQEFIVTLDGFEKGKEKQDIEEAKRSRRQPSDREHKRKNSSSFTQSDEEFEEILRKKQKEEEEAKHRHHSSRRSRRSHRSRKSRSPKEELDDIDREIMIAEKKLKAQKLLKKSLDQVQSLNTENFTFENNKPKTAFVNPHFRPKVDIPVMNVVPLNISGQPIVAQQSIPPVAAPLSVLPSQSLAMLQQQQQQQQNLANLVTNVTTKSSTPLTVATDVEYMADSSSDKMLTTHPSTSAVSLPNKVAVMATSTSDVTSPTIDKKRTTIAEQQTSKVKQMLPSQSQMIGTRKIPCNTFPNCTFGKRCVYSHPVCKFGERCTSMHCIYNHENITTVGSLNAMCKFYPSCMNSSCPYKHPIQKACRFGTKCLNKECAFVHENTSDTKWIAAKPHLSERKFAVDNDVVSNPVSIITTPTSKTKPHTDEET